MSALKKMKSRKAAGMNGIVVKMLKDDLGVVRDVQIGYLY